MSDLIRVLRDGEDKMRTVLFIVQISFTFAGSKLTYADKTPEVEA